MAWQGNQGQGGQRGGQHGYGNSGDSDRQGERPSRPPWTDHARQALQALLKSGRLNESTKALLEKYAAERTPSNNMVATVYKIYVEKFHRPSKDYVIQAWQPDGEPQPRQAAGEQRQDEPAYEQPAEQPKPRPQQQQQRRPRQQQAPAKPVADDGSQQFGQDRWGDGPDGQSGQGNDQDA